MEKKQELEKMLQEDLDSFLKEKFKHTGFVLITVDFKNKNSEPKLISNLAKEQLGSFLIHVGNDLVKKPEGFINNYDVSYKDK